jgi:molybdenum cofactor cytidylyltransferase
MGTPKPLLPWGKRTMLGETLHNLSGSTVGGIVVVTGAEADAVARIAAQYNARAVFNPDYATGEMISSLQIAIRALPAGCAGILVVLADQPLIPTEIFDQVIRAFEQGDSRIITPIYQGRRGHPVLFGRRFFADLLALPPAGAPRDVLRANPDAVYYLPAESDTILLDMDRPGEYERYRPRAVDEE